MTATRFHWDHSPPGFNRDNTAYLCLVWDCEPGDARFFRALNAVGNRILRETGMDPADMTADIMVKWHSDRYWRKLGLGRRPARGTSSSDVQRRLIGNAIGAVFDAMNRPRRAG